MVRDSKIKSTTVGKGGRCDKRRTFEAVEQILLGIGEVGRRQRVRERGKGLHPRVDLALMGGCLLKGRRRAVKVRQVWIGDRKRVREPRWAACVATRLRVEVKASAEWSVQSLIRKMPTHPASFLSCCFVHTSNQSCLQCRHGSLYLHVLEDAPVEHILFSSALHNHVV